MEESKDYIEIKLYAGDTRLASFLICREQLKKDFGLDFDILDISNMENVFKYCWREYEPSFRVEYEKVYVSKE